MVWHQGVVAVVTVLEPSTGSCRDQLVEFGAPLVAVKDRGRHLGAE